MEVIEIVQELRRELERIDKLILALDSFQSGRRRGASAKASPATERRGRGASEDKKAQEGIEVLLQEGKEEARQAKLSRGSLPAAGPSTD